MKTFNKHTLLVTLLTVAFMTKAQQITYAKIIINKAYNNNENMTPIVVGQNACTVFYKPDNDNHLLMANYWAVNKSQSYGAIYSVAKPKRNTTYKGYKADKFNFIWQYFNTYNDDSGTADLEIIKQYKPTGTEYILLITLQNKETIVYIGAMQGNIDFGKY